MKKPVTKNHPPKRDGSPPDPISPNHYRGHPKGFECIDVIEEGFTHNAATAIKYLWRYLEKEDPIQDLQKAQRYIDFEIRRLKRGQPPNNIV